MIRSDGSGHSVSGVLSHSEAVLMRSVHPNHERSGTVAVSGGGVNVRSFPGSGHVMSGTGHQDGDVCTRSVTVCPLRPGSGLLLRVTRSDGSGHSVSGVLSHSEAVLMRSVHPNHERSGTVAVSGGGVHVRSFPGSGHVMSGTGHQDGDVCTRSVTVCPLRPGSGLPLRMTRSDKSGHSVSGVLSHSEAVLVRSVHPNHERSGTVAVSGGGVHVRSFPGSGHVMSGTGHQDGDVCTRSVTVCPLRPGSGLPLRVTRSDGSGHSVSGVLSHSEAVLVRSVHPNHERSGTVAVSGGGVNVRSFPGSGHVMSGTGHQDGDVCTRSVTVCPLRPGSGLLLRVTRSDGSGHSVSGVLSHSEAVLMRSVHPNHERSGTVAVSGGGVHVRSFPGSGHVMSGTGHQDGDVCTRSVTVCPLRPGSGLPLRMTRSDKSGHSVSGVLSHSEAVLVRSVHPNHERNGTVAVSGGESTSGHFPEVGMSCPGQATKMEMFAPEVSRFELCGPAVDFRFG